MSGDVLRRVYPEERDVTPLAFLESRCREVRRELPVRWSVLAEFGGYVAVFGHAAPFSDVLPRPRRCFGMCCGVDHLLLPTQFVVWWR